VLPQHRRLCLPEHRCLLRATCGPQLKRCLIKPNRCPSIRKPSRASRKRSLVSHYENNYVGAVKRLNAIGTQLAELDFAKAPNFVINGLKREELDDRFHETGIENASIYGTGSMLVDSSFEKS
jgi:hypothetical protein